MDVCWRYPQTLKVNYFIIISSKTYLVTNSDSKFKTVDELVHAIKTKTTEKIDIKIISSQ